MVIAVPASRARPARLTSDEERHLAQVIEAGRAATAALSEGRIRGRRRGHLQTAVEAGDAARTEFTLRNARLVATIAMSYRASGVDLADLIGEGNIGLLNAVDSFDWRYGTPFSAWANRFIRKEIERQGMVNHSLIRLPVDVIYDRRTVDIAQEEIRRKHGSGVDPSAAQIAAHTGLTERRVQQILGYPREPRSLDMTFAAGDSWCVADTIPAMATDPGSAAERSDLLARTVEAFAPFTPTERVVLLHRCGAIGGPTGLNEIGEQLAMTAKQVRAVELGAIAKCRHPRNAIVARGATA